MKFSNLWKIEHSPRTFLWVIIGFVFFVIACYPGFMSPDSLEQYKQAHTLQFADGHPPVMAWLWSKLNLIFDGPQSLLFVHLGMLWIGLYIWHRNAGENHSAKWFILLGFFPWVVNFEGVLWKDVGMAFSMLLAIGLLSRSKITFPQGFVAVSLLLYAFMVRSNAPAALLPIVWYATGRLLPMLSNRIKVAITSLLMVMMFVFLNFFNYQLLSAEKNHMDSYMMVDDLVHLSEVADKSLLPRIDYKTVKECSQETIGDTKLVGRLFCLITKPSYQNVAPIPYEEIKKAWVAAVKVYPLEYAQFRLNAYLYLLRDPSEKPYIYWFSGISTNEIGLVQNDNAATILLKGYVWSVAHLLPFLFKPYWWLTMASLFLCATFIMQGDDKDSLTLIRVLLISGLLYMFSYIPVTPMADFRYVYWSTLAISLAAIKYATSSLYFRFEWQDLRTKLHVD
ncbi:hypothetical protein [Sulfuriferula nivalis]|uniref:Glycosyltransferase RgtA/B/C/D-like domain-containing protein n=1 Tax=Sulfuriferula nivalis TaxID=2675298 RepID=A0A809S0A3_9PROT|nr:hypothetical protein [Sulfuriferula nivalis]BBO99927.1 hypothetical protein SFSGTM_06360 [Sulfuriferula nivalis]